MAAAVGGSWRARATCGGATTTRSRRSVGRLQVVGRKAQGRVACSCDVWTTSRERVRRQRGSSVFPPFTCGGGGRYVRPVAWCWGDVGTRDERWQWWTGRPQRVRPQARWSRRANEGVPIRDGSGSGGLQRQRPEGWRCTGWGVCLPGSSRRRGYWGSHGRWRRMRTAEGGQRSRGNGHHDTDRGMQRCGREWLGGWQQSR